MGKYFISKQELTMLIKDRCIYLKEDDISWLMPKVIELAKDNKITTNIGDEWLRELVDTIDTEVYVNDTYYKGHAKFIRELDRLLRDLYLEGRDVKYTLFKRTPYSVIKELIPFTEPKYRIMLVLILRYMASSKMGTITTPFKIKSNLLHIDTLRDDIVTSKLFYSRKSDLVEILGHYNAHQALRWLNNNENEYKQNILARISTLQDNIVIDSRDLLEIQLKSLSESKEPIISNILSDLHEVRTSLPMILRYETDIDLRDILYGIRSYMLRNKLEEEVYYDPTVFELIGEIYDTTMLGIKEWLGLK